MSRPAGAPLEERVASELARLISPGLPCVLAVSGGPDSLAMLDLLGRPSAGRPLFVAHVDHGIDPGSAGAAQLVAAAAAARGLPSRIVRLELGPGASETMARRERRAALRSIALESGAAAIALAHHADDQAETVLFRLLRGSGPAGLAGMAARHGPWVRPLLGVRRSELLEHVRRRGLAPWLDPANSDPRHLRSWLRTVAIPQLASRLPDLFERLNGAAAQAAAARVGWREILSLLPALDVVPDGRGISVAAPVLQGYRSELRHAVLAALGREIGVLLGARRLGAIERLLVGRSGGGRVALGRRVGAELAFGRLSLFEIQPASAARITLVPGEVATLGAARFDTRIEPAEVATRGGWRADFSPGEYAVRQWQAGDRIRPLGGAGSRAVRVLLRESRIPPSRREAWPVVVSARDATIVWVPGICRADAAVPAEGTEAWRVECAIA